MNEKYLVVQNVHVVLVIHTTDPRVYASKSIQTDMTEKTNKQTRTGYTFKNNMFEQKDTSKTELKKNKKTS